MNKITSLTFVFLFLMQLHVSAQEAGTNPVPELPVQPSDMALRVDYFGGFTGYDVGGYQLLRSALGQMIADGTLGTFLTVAIGKGGGGSFCVQMSPYSSKTIDDVMSVLDSIRPADGVTVYRFNKLLNCDQNATHNKEVPQ